ncbi:YicC/YloC family endoribonuclease [Thiobacillus sp.]|uniref:YicC/YloC family endoribonuclease n=1 Tax=Thiobacillus sp. TaxID=924 RepID=UPI0017B0F45D|nr:YicC/YloC family endoribonuclease [Thiobacillus sp.]MBC2731936.1 YicC family protein [Thiobacillus sp.]MBC2740674.1 YicC family protein [Thiobacillus sp.]MBC2758473.1 YicC family protein [Thiobacillus sp.]
MTTSMTGFAAHSLNLDHASVNIDLRSVNQRYLELHFRLADEFRALEPQLRELIQQRLARGKVECRIGLAILPAASLDNGLNPDILERLAHWQADVMQRLPGSPPLSVNEILRWPGAMQSGALSQEALNEAALAGIRTTLDELVESRQREGAKLKQHILDRLAAAEAQVAGLQPLLPTLAAAQRDKLAERLRDALGEAGHERLAQEVALAAQKADIDEELSRLATHFSEVRRVLNQTGAVGKRLDFLMQELHREANTLGSKSVAVETSRVSLELKVLIEQMREQVQNIE